MRAGFAAPVGGTSQFAVEFSAGGPNDANGSSLRELDLQPRLFRHSLSILIASRSFAGPPDEVRARFWQRLDGVQAGVPTPCGLAPSDRSTIHGIVSAPVPESARGARQGGPEAGRAPS